MTHDARPQSIGDKVYGTSSEHVIYNDTSEISTPVTRVSGPLNGFKYLEHLPSRSWTDKHGRTLRHQRDENVRRNLPVPIPWPVVRTLFPRIDLFPSYGFRPRIPSLSQLGWVPCP